jgi:hypothetical protein
LAPSDAVTVYAQLETFVFGTVSCAGLAVAALVIVGQLALLPTPAVQFQVVLASPLQLAVSVTWSVGSGFGSATPPLVAAIEHVSD